ncbi:hypothetical protein PN462_09575 [Spirulina sp. CS-785/01]|uniref:hypothetical protein n=1 Tax=Spirulina sp. CS-785/01 TaxID=3021716 RepID=UPI0023308214|nr:hypothetical protein [Spirulina sp. CS-785/01]MDB9313347.1 hypothetical protein [Spirulina sp. CS-785/01]
MIEIETLKTEIQNLSPEAQQKVAEFVQSLKANAEKNQAQSVPLKLENHHFVGMWSDRPETQDSQQWVRNLRQNQWTR